MKNVAMERKGCGPYVAERVVFSYKNISAIPAASRKTLITALT